MKMLWMLLAMGLSFSATAADIAAGETKAQACVGCHGAQGKSLVPTFPKLAGQYAVYVEDQLRAFKNGERKNPMMTPFAAGLSDADMSELAAYFEAQK
jgi:cytochrome c553